MDKQTALQNINTALSIGDAQGVIDTLESFNAGGSREYFTLEELKSFAKDLPVTIDGAEIALTYSGDLGTPAYKLANSIAANSNGAVAIIDNTKAFSLIESDAFNNSVRVSLSKSSDTFLQTIDANRYIWGTDDFNGIINDVSYNFAKNNDIPMRSLVPSARDSGVWTQSEIQGFLDGSSPEVEGLSRGVVTNLYKD